MFISHKIRLDPSKKQRTYLCRAAGVARFAYNWALTEWQRQYEAYKRNPTLDRPNQIALRRKLNAIKRTEFPWMLQVTKCAPQAAIIQLGRAFDNFFDGHGRYPTYRRKGKDDRFALSNEQFRIEGKRLRIPKLGWVRMREALRFEGHVVSASLSRYADHWFASITIECPHLPPRPTENQGAVGVDLGVITFATLSTGEKITGPKSIQGLLAKVRRLSRAVSRKMKGSSNRTKAKLRLARVHAKIASIRCNSLHQLTASLTRRFNMVCIEDLHVKKC